MSRSRVEFDDREFVREARRAPVREYDDYRDPARVPAWMMRGEERPNQAGQLVLRAREVETMERQRPRSPSPQVRVRERLVERARSVSPGPRRVEEDIRFRAVSRTREASRGPSERVRYVERPRSPSPSVHERIRITDRREERRSPSPAPPPPPPQPQVIKGPTIEREVITHYRDIDHGMVVARPPSPPPRQEHRHTDIDIYTSGRRTEVDIQKHTHSHNRGRSVERPSRPVVHAYDDGLVISSDQKHLQVDIERRRSVSRGRRAHSAAPPVIDHDDDEAYEIKSRIDARGKMGEAWNGITKDWTIIDVPPGTERVRMDGAGGASAEVTWQKYSGVRRAKFIPDRDEKSVVSTTSTTISDTRDRDRDREIERERRLSVQIIDKDRRDRDRDGEYEKITDRRLTISKSRTNSPAPPPPPPQRRSETWTEITKDLVCREAIEQCGYEYEETEYFYYIIDFLAHEEVVRLVNLSDRIRQSRKDRAREIQYEREWRDEWEHRHHHQHSHSHSSSRHRLDDERVVEREIIYDSHRHPKQYRY